eukprot:TRINITY_DN7528_c0_g1_i1.p1 TRINITY_DN7528_c0_g1~~TRINITY_DN7528_c0_g1_i1.p1  ORF type:complete len:167 (+),score=30.31 TRINITY_DN7528_c0_g1_i1:618-1118(+)
MNLEQSAKIIDAELAGNIEMVWADKGIQEVYKQRSRTQLLDSAPHFFERASIIAQKDYVPSTDDIILSRTRTTGFTEAEFEFKGTKIKVTDVGGQRSERKKWLHFFEKCSVCVFFAALSEYDRTLFEDDEISGMEEALKLFREICSSRWFQNIHIVLFLNKEVFIS